MKTKGAVARRVNAGPAQQPCSYPLSWTHVVFWIESPNASSDDVSLAGAADGISEAAFDALIGPGRVLEKRLSAPDVLYAAELTFLTADDSAAFRRALSAAVCAAGTSAHVRNYSDPNVSRFWRERRRWADGQLHVGTAIRFFDAGEPSSLTGPRVDTPPLNHK